MFQFHVSVLELTLFGSPDAPLPGSVLMGDAPPASANASEFVQTRGAGENKKIQFDAFTALGNEGKEGNEATTKSILTTKSGRTFDTDLAFFCTGPQPNKNVYEHHYKLGKVKHFDFVLRSYKGLNNIKRKSKSQTPKTFF